MDPEGNILWEQDVQQGAIIEFGSRQPGVSAASGNA